MQVWTSAIAQEKTKQPLSKSKLIHLKNKLRKKEIKLSFVPVKMIIYVENSTSATYNCMISKKVQEVRMTKIYSIFIFQQK